MPSTYPRQSHRQTRCREAMAKAAAGEPTPPRPLSPCHYSEAGVKNHLQLSSAGGNSPLIIPRGLGSSPLLQQLWGLGLMLPLGHLIPTRGFGMPMTEALIPFLTALVLPKGTVSSPRSQHQLFSLSAPQTPLFFPPRYFLLLYLLLLRG